MSVGSFKANVLGTYKSCIDTDDGTVSGAAGAAWSLVNCLIPATLWHFFMIPAYNTPGDHIPFVVGFFMGILALPFVIVTFLACTVPGALAAGFGALFGLIRKKN